MEKVIFDGQLINRLEASVDIEDRGYQFGDGVYEVIRVYNGKMFTSKEHLQRLFESGEKIGMDIPYGLDKIKAMLEDLIQANNLTLGTVYLQVTRGVAPRNHMFPSSDVKPMFVAYTREVARPEENMMNGVKTISVEDIRWLLCDIKSLNLLGNLLAKQKAADAGCFEAIQHRNGTVTEGSLSNVSIVVDGVVKTHPANHLILNGISRQVMLKTCEKAGIPFAEKPYTLDELKNADEVFLTGTTVEVMPIIEVDGQRIGNGKPGEITKKLQELFKAEIEEQCGQLFIQQ
ncbi:D-amino-acid transaminase [Peribacillus tepidiphilus]|uniref:D-amino-acid transaminase n=1 Tax=Peribacillus tepidiphilus TaxID=2652445 RepID=UPI0035B5313D